MKAKIRALAVGFGFFFNLSIASEARPTTPAELSGIISNFPVPGVEFKETPIKTALEFTLGRWHDVSWFEHPGHDFKVELRLNEVTLKRTVNLNIKNTTMGHVIDAIFPDGNYELILRPGRIILQTGGP